MTTNTPDLARMRREYADAPLREGDLAPDWHAQFARWLGQAIAAEVPEPNAMVIATATADGVPSARTVLLKGFDAAGFTFYTNYDSRKGRDLDANPAASLVFSWLPLHRQVVVAGTVTRVSRAETEAYFAVRPRESQLGAWASPQSSVVPGRDAIEDAWAAVTERFPGPVPTPPNWGGYRVEPTSVEFWQGRRNRLHDRLRYRRERGTWIVERLAP